MASAHGLFNVRVFGSIARGEDTAHSDIDLLVDLEKVAADILRAVKDSRARD